ncbi:MAG TPA: hypothetical protein PLQ11_07190 [Beijerinckiaceae bacterium]|nr:hypothetical protein [Beijerinckiaceae bacterium]
MAGRKTWREKMGPVKSPEVTTLARAMVGGRPGDRLLIPTPHLVRDYVVAIPRGETRDVLRLRADLAEAAGADVTCPLTTGMFLRIVAEAALEDAGAGAPQEAVTPFWRVVDPVSPLARKLSCGPAFIEARRHEEACA